MGLNDTPESERVNIGFFGVRNAGKSSVVNAVTGQDLAVVSDVAGTTTDPVRKAMELLPIGPVLIIDTPGFDDTGKLGELRVRKTRRVLNAADVAVLVVDAVRGMTPVDEELVRLFRDKRIPYAIAWNKADLLPGGTAEALADGQVHTTDDGVRFAGLAVSAADGRNIYVLKELIGALAVREEQDRRIIADLVAPGETVVLVVPVDSAAPKGRLILPQQQTIRDLLDNGSLAYVTRESELAQTLDSLNEPPRMVVTDSQVFGYVAKVVPSEIPLTSFSMLFARYKGDLALEVDGARSLDELADGDRVLISEGCTHHRQCDDIGTVKMPRWISKYTGKNLEYEWTSGREFPEDLTPYRLVVHCGGCMLNAREMRWRLRHAAAQGVPITNYGVAIAKVHGILPRVLSPFGL
ncbi:MAG: [FeFe] hydrogenase H-cluster maturation GTPase HydF [Eggerthellaceae bacterium]|jgi:[FeFe] hydrogenase H-cluster maturation GTPase HydF